MKKFWEYVESVEGPKPWKAKKADVMQHWQTLQPNLPIPMQPVSEHHRGTRFHFDGIRITGTPAFINSIMGRLKDLVKFEGANNQRLDIEYRQIVSKNSTPNETPQFVFYCHLVQDEDFKNPQSSI